MKEPSVLDYFLAKIQFWKKSELDFTPYLQESRVTDLKEWDEALMDDFVRQDVNSTDSNAQKSAAEDQSVSAKSSAAVPWRILLTLFFAIAGQSVMEPPTPNFGLAIGLYVLSAAFMIWAVTRKELRLSDSPVQRQRPFGLEYKSTPMLLSVPFLLGAFLTFGNNRFNLLNLLLWLIGFALVVYGLWLPKKRAEGEADFISKVECFLRNPSIHFHIGKWELLLLVMALVGVFFKTYALAETPAEMFSDHAEKLLDVQDVLEGTTSIFFERNTGREAFQMYLTAFVSETFGTGISFMSLKLGTVLCGILILPYLYLLGKELGNRWVGLLALGFIGIAYWPNVIARVGLRFILYAFFTAPTLYYFLRGMRHSNRNDLILAGVFLGLGLHGYSSFRFVPVVIVIGVLLFLLHQRTGNSRFSASIWSLLVIALVSFVVFLPLFRYMLSNPTMFSYRMATRLGTLEREYPGSPILIFFGNYLKANLMFFWTNGNTWVHSVTNRPALDVVTAASYFIGLALLVIRYVRQRKWEDLFLLVSIPMLLMPSILSLAFPDENPSLNRTSGAMVPVILVAAMGLEAVLRGLFDQMQGNGKKWLVGGIGMLLFFWSAGMNYDLVFNQYHQQFLAGSWNTTELGHVIRGFADSVGSEDSAYVIPYPHWADTRLVGINAGVPRKDYALQRDMIETTLPVTEPKLFLFKDDDIETMERLMAVYPDGLLTLHESEREGKDFFTYLVPAVVYHQQETN